MNWWQYLLLVNVYLLLFYGFYTLLLRSETFFRLNRAYLIGSVILAFVIPVIQAEWLRNLFITRQINQTIYMLDMVYISASPQQVNQSLNVGQLLTIIYLIGVTAFLIRFVIRLIKLNQAIKNKGTHNAFSFFGKINIGDQVPEVDIVTEHEEVHVKQWHSADILLIELIAIINWFNPVVYLYRKSVKHIHEFIADDEVINQGTAKQDYAMLLLSQTFNAPVSQLANSFFNHSLLKQRIMMLHKNPSQRKARLKYGLCAPLFALMVILSSAMAKTNALVTNISKKATAVLDLKPTVIVNNSPVHAAFDNADITTKKIESTYPSTQDKKALTKSDTSKDEPIFSSVQQSAIPTGGLEAFYRFLGTHIQYPAEARKNGVQGRVVCTFVVEKDGSLSNLRIVRGVGSGLDEESIRVLSICPKWEPGRQNGKIVRQQYTVPIQFTLQDMPKSNLQGSLRKDTSNHSPLSIITYVKGDTSVLKKPDYYINGVLATSDAWHNIHPKDILSVDVKGPTPEHPDAKREVWIRTKN